jgi:selenium metabolism protein YedF
MVEPQSTYIVYINSDNMGTGEEELGRLLMGNFLKTLVDAERHPEKILFVNRGVFLTTEGSELIETLKVLGRRSVKLLSCGTCLDYYGRKDKLKVGSATNMFEIVTSLASAEKVIKP